MAPVNGQATESSPLLPKDSVLPNEPVVSTEQSVANGTAKDALRNVAGDDVERQDSDDDSPAVHEGLPEVKKRMKWILPAVGIGVFLAAADQTLIVSSYGKIGSDLHALNNTSWIATAYFLTLSSFQPLYGKLSDIFGRKACLLFAYTIFGLGCLFCGLAPSMNTLIAARAFAGIGAGGMTTVVSILLSDAVPLRERGTWQGYVNLIFASGAGSGAPLGGILSESIGWRWAFLGQAPLCVLAIIATALLLKLPKQDDSHWKEKLRRIDFLGAFCLISAIFLLLLGMDHGSNFSWKSTLTIVSLCVSVPMFAIFLFVEMKIASEPFAPGHIIFERSLFACYLCNFFSFCGYMATLFYMPLHFQVIDGKSPTQAGVLLIPGVAASVIGSLGGGIYMQKTGRYYWLTVSAYGALTLGLVIIFVFSGPFKMSVVGMILGLCLGAFANGIGVTTSLIGLISNASRTDQAVATACSYLFRSLGCVFGVSLSATVANQVLRNSLHDALGSGKDADEIAENVRQSIAYLRALKPAVRAVVIECYRKSTSSAFALQIALVGGAFLSAWFIREAKLSR